MEKSSNKLWLRDVNWSAFSLLVVTIVLCVFLDRKFDTFWTYQNMYSIVQEISMECFAIFGFTFLMIMGEIDLSVGAVYAFSGYFVAYLMAFGMPVWPAIVCAILACALIGVVNGTLVVRFRLNSLMMTIGMMLLMLGLRDVLSELMGGSTLKSSYRAIARVEIGDVRVTIIAMIAIILVLEFLLRKSAAFKKIYYVGENLTSATIYGIRAGRIKVLTFIASSVGAGIGGILATSHVSAANVTTGDKLEFKMVTAAILGGCSLFGGKGSIANSALALLFLGIVVDGMVKYDVEVLIQQLVIGIILIIAVYVDTLMNKEKIEY